MPRPDGRQAHELRPLSVERNFIRSSPGSVLVRAGGTAVLCTASIADEVPPWKAKADPPTGWLTSEYSMLPGSTSPRKPRERSRADGRTTEIQRLIGRSLRAVVDFEALGPRTITIDCDVLEADGGTRTLSVTGGFLALAGALAAAGAQSSPTRPVLTDSIAAVSVGVYGGEVIVDLDYREDSNADVDLNVVMTGRGRFVEIQGTAEHGTFDRDRLDEMLARAEAAIAHLTRIQRQVLGSEWPLDSSGPSC